MNEGVEPGGWAGKRRAPWPLFGPFRRSLRRSNEVTRGATALLDCPRGDCMTQGSMCQAGVHVRLLKRQLHQGAPGITRTRDSLGAFSSRYAETCACHTASPPSCWQWPSRSWGPAAGARTLPCSRQRLSARRPGNPALRGHAKAGWVSGLRRPYCANGHEAPAPNTGDQSVGEVRFTGLKRSAAGGGISQGVGTLPEGGTVGLEVRGETAGTLLARGMCEGMMVKAAFYDQRFTDGAKGTISIQRADDVPVIVLRLDGEIIAPDREVVGDLSWLPAQDKQLCAFAVQ
jgi:hypothetical protein